MVHMALVPAVLFYALTSLIRVTTAQGQTADTGVSDNSFSPDIDLVPDSENVMQPTATDILPTDPPTTTATTESTTAPANTTTVILTTSDTTANSVVQTGTSSGPVIHVPTNPVQFTPPPPPPPSRSHRGSFWNLLQLLLALGSEGGLGPLLLSQQYQRPNQQSANSLFGILPPWAMFSKKLRPVYLASQSSGHLGSGLTGKTVATGFLGLPEGYPGARFISNRNSRRPAGISSRQEQSPGFTGRRPFRNIPFRPWMLGMMET